MSPNSSSLCAEIELLFLSHVLLIVNSLQRIIVSKQYRRDLHIELFFSLRCQ